MRSSTALFSKHFAFFLACSLGSSAALDSLQQPMAPAELVRQLDAVINLKQIALAMNQYAAEHDGAYPFAKDMKTLKVVTYPYVKTKDAWRTTNPRSEFRMNYSLGGVVTKDVKDASGTVLLYESRPWRDGRRAVAFVDGSARLLPAHEWAVASLSLLANLPRKGDPLPESIGKNWKDE